MPIPWVCSHRDPNCFPLWRDPAHLLWCLHGNRFAGCWGLAVQRNKCPSSCLERGHGPSAGNCSNLSHCRWLSVCVSVVESGIPSVFDFGSCISLSLIVCLRVRQSVCFCVRSLSLALISLAHRGWDSSVGRTSYWKHRYRRNFAAGSSPRCGKRFFSQCQPPVQTLLITLSA